MQKFCYFDIENNKEWITIKIYFDENIKYIDVKNEKVIIYSPHNHKTVKVDKGTSEIIKTITNEGSGQSFVDTYPHLDLINAMVSHRIFFENIKQFEEENYYGTMLAMKRQYKPNIAYVHITQRCNLECSYCYNKKNLNKWEELNTEEWKKVLDELSEKNVKTIVFTGGEPLLRSDLLDIIKYAKNKRFVVSILTNGTLLNSCNYELYDYVDNMIVSLDSIQESINDKTRKNSIKYSTLENLKNIPLNYRSKISVRSVITNENVDQIENMRIYCEKELNYTFLTTIFIPNSKEEVGMVPTIDIQEMAENIGDYVFKNKLICCGACYKEFAINSNGDIYPCHNLIQDEFYITNIMDDNWYIQLRDNEISQKLTNLTVENIDKCNECSWRYMCGSGCRAIAYKVYGEIDAHLDFFCDYLGKEAVEKIKLLKFV